MRLVWHTLWGSAAGPVTRLAPQTRVLCAATVVAACLAAPVATLPGIAVATAIVTIWLSLCRPPAVVVRDTLCLGVVVLSPVLLLTPLLRTGDGGWIAAAAAPWSMLAHGLAVMLVSVTAAATLSLSALRQGLVRLPIPEVVAAILLQIVHQTGALMEETRRVAAAIAVRGGASGPLAGGRLLAALPSVWLPRVLLRAERVAAAMELRGLTEVDLRELGSAPAAASDVLAVVTAVLALVGVLALRSGVGG